MSKSIKVALAGAGAFGIKHLDGIQNIDGVEVVSLISRDIDKTKEVAAKYGIGHVTTDLADSLALKEVDAVILCTPTQMHASQAIACMKAEFPLAHACPLSCRQWLVKHAFAWGCTKSRRRLLSAPVSRPDRW